MDLKFAPVLARLFFGMRIRTKKRKLLRRLTLAATASFAFLVAQGIAFEHELDLESHAPDQVCEICISVAGFDAGDVGTPTVFVSADVSFSSPIHVAILALEDASRYHLARGPPLTS